MPYPNYLFCHPIYFLAYYTTRKNIGMGNAISPFHHTPWSIIHMHISNKHPKHSHRSQIPTEFIDTLILFVLYLKSIGF